MEAFTSVRTFGQAVAIVENLIAGGYRDGVAIYFVSDSIGEPDLALRLMRRFWGEGESDLTPDEIRELNDIDGNDGHWH